MKRKLLIVPLLCLALCGCSTKQALPDYPIIFHTELFLDPANSTDGYMSISLYDRTYIPYGTLEDKISWKNDVDCCLGYVQQEREEPDLNCRIFRLNGTDDFLMEYNVAGTMEQPFFYRATDTQGQDIDIPAYISDLGYSFWNPSE